MKKTIAAILAGALCLTALTACGGSTGSKDETKSDGGATGTSKTLKIGGIGPLTGGTANYGNSVRQGAELAVKEINAAGGVNGLTFELDFQDSAGDAAQAVMKLIQLDTPYELAPYTGEAGCAQQPYLPAKDGDMEPVSIEEFSVEDD